MCLLHSILNISKNKIIFTQNQVRHEPSEIFFSDGPLGRITNKDKEWQMAKVAKEEKEGFVCIVCP